MHRFSRMHLSPDVALRTLDTIDLEEKSRVAEGIALLAVIDERRDYLAAGYSCMRNYCMERLHWSEDRTLRRLQVARKALCFPDLYEYLADGRLSVTTAAVLAPHLTEANAASLLSAAAFKSRPEIVQLLDSRSRPSTTPDTPTLTPDVQESSESHAPVHATSPTDLAMTTTCDAAHAPVHATNRRRGRVTANADGTYELRLTLTPEEHEALTKTQALLGHAVPSGDLAEIHARAVKHYLAHLEKQRLGARPAAAPTHEPKGRGIPKPLRKLVWERDGGRCAFVSADGHRCGETFRLEIDHIIPRALGGTTTADNLRLLCRAHNQHEARRVLGEEHIQTRRELAQRNRAREKAAAKAETERAQAAARERDATSTARREDVHAALLGLGFRGSEARRGAAVADAMPDASLDQCLRQALTELTRPIAIRGERMARSTA